MGMSPKLLRPRQTGLDPRSISGLFAWWDASANSTITSSSGLVSSLADRSGNGRNAAQSTGVNQPSLGLVNARQALVTDAGKGLIAATTYTITAQSTFAVFKADSYLSFGRVLVQESDTENAVYIPLLLPNDSTYKIGSYIGGAFRSGVAITQSAATIGESHHNGSTVTCVANGVSGTPYATSLNFTPTKIVLGNSAALTAAFSGRIGEVLMWNRALTSDEILKVRRYLASKWGIAL